jgi:hypothetical protein
MWHGTHKLAALNDEAVAYKDFLWQAIYCSGNIDYYIRKKDAKRGHTQFLPVG